MHTIQPIGAFLSQNSNGFIINDLSLDKLDTDWKNAVLLAVDFYKKKLGHHLHSLYLRGSVARGVAVKGVSDLDVFGLIYSKEKIRWKTVTFQNELEKTLKQQFDFIKGIDAAIASFEEDFYTRNPRLAMIIQTQSICILGESLSPTLPKFQPNREMCLNLNWLAEDISDFLKKIDQNNNTLEDCQAIMKVLIRSGFELVIDQEKRYTPDLYLSYQTFSNYFPHYQNQMRSALKWYLNPIIHPVQLKELIENLGYFLLNQTK